MNRNSIIIINIIFIILIISCKSNNKDSNGIVINLGVEPRTIDPALNNNNSDASYILSAFEGLTRKDQDNNIIPGVAERWEISEDGLVYTFYLRTNAKWSDGKPVTANDFVYAWRRVVDPITASPFSTYLEPIKNAKEVTSGKKTLEELGVKAIDDYTLEVILNTPTAYFLAFTGYYTLCPIRKDIIEKYGDNWSLKAETYIGNGPFKVVERNIDEKIVMIKNPNYWDIENIKPEKLTFVMMEDPNASLSGIKNGSMHLSKSVSRNIAPELKMENIIENINLLATAFLRVDGKSDNLKDIRIRKALSLAIDRNYLVKNITRMNEEIAYNYVPKNIQNYDISRNTNYINDDYKRNIEEAKKLFAEAGYTNGKGFPVLDLTVGMVEYNVEVCEAIQNMWKENLGIDVRINKYEYNTYLQFVVSRNAKDLVLYTFFADYNDPISFLLAFESSSSINHLNYSNTNYDRLIMIASTNNNLDERTRVLYEAEKLLIEDVGIMPLFYMNLIILKSQKLKGLQYDPTGFILFDNAYIE
ncbi:peptide ABC transporter substrate-binding protein [Brachyspira intermedia]|uniref:peptide ABC transporter substrate-binding protein n=1 Tax=Brachyspira intermedia TaxID=84377 RepID=UPI003004F576